MKYFICFLAFFQIAFAQSIEVKNLSLKTVGSFALGTGSLINLESDNSSWNGETIFLGSAINPAGEETYKILLNTKSENINLIPSHLFKHDQLEQKILDPYEQKGGTCTAYAMFDFLSQFNLMNFQGTGALKQTLGSEEGRTQLLADTINQYYLTLNHRYSINGILNGYGKNFGFKCHYYKPTTFENAKNYLIKFLNKGLPVIVSFNIGPDMVEAPFKMFDLAKSANELDNRLWVPRKSGERNNGGHSIVAAATFNFKQKDYMLMIDSDWSEPRVWDMDRFLGGKTKLDEIDFIVCQ